jgi:tRNA pseudouridine38-40 synthase
MTERQTLLLELAYPGAPYRGVHVQPGLRTVASDLRTLLVRVCGHEPRALTFAARTDSGVNAQQNFATCVFQRHKLTEGHLRQLELGANPLVVRRAQFVERGVNARTHARHKHYQYRLSSEIEPVHVYPTSATDRWNIHPKLDIEMMRRAAQRLTGNHDYSAFRSRRCDAKDPLKTIDSFDVTQTKNQFTFDIQGAAFLRHMVRILVGTVVEVGAGLRSVESVQAALIAKNRTLAGMTAPAAGLWLMAVTLNGTRLGAPPDEASNG